MFNGEITIKRVNVKRWELVGDVSYQNEKLKVTAKSGLKTDGASIPRAFWGVIGSPLTGKYVKSAILHDALYASEALPRKQCDELFREMLKAEGVSMWRRNTMYWAVRAGGGRVWKRHTKKSIDRGRRYCEVIGF